MEIAVRYFSALGKTRAIAEEIAAGAGVQAISIVDEPELTQRYDVLFLGGAPYANIMAPELKAYAERLSADKVGEVVLFTTSNWSRRTVLALRKILKSKGIPVASEHFYAHMVRIAQRKQAAHGFGESRSLGAAIGTYDKKAIAAEAVSSTVIVASAAVALVLLHVHMRKQRQ